MYINNMYEDINKVFSKPDVHHFISSPSINKIVYSIYE